MLSVVDAQGIAWPWHVSGYFSKSGIKCAKDCVLSRFKANKLYEYEVLKRLGFVCSIVILITSCSNSNDREAVTLAVSGGCTLISNAYDSWAATGQSTATETGRMGRENLENSFNTARNEISKFITEAEIDKAQDSDWSDLSRSPSQVLIQITNIQKFINSWELVTNLSWTAGDHISNDEKLDSLKETCEIFSKSN